LSRVWDYGRPNLVFPVLALGFVWVGFGFGWAFLKSRFGRQVYTLRGGDGASFEIAYSVYCSDVYLIL
jgi:hypothetical protein